MQKDQWPGGAQLQRDSPIARAVVPGPNWAPNLALLAHMWLHGLRLPAIPFGACRLTLVSVAIQATLSTT